MNLVLASQSPRRRFLLESVGLRLEVRVADIDESRGPGEGPSAMAERLAREKAAAVVCGRDELVIAADTVVALEGEVFGKPASDEEAVRMLSALSGRAHEVVTGYCVRGPRREVSGAVQTAVWFRSLSPEEIEHYVSSREPFDKAGAYGIQGGGGALIDRVEGSYPNVVGLPVAEVLAAIRELGGA